MVMVVGLAGWHSSDKLWIKCPGSLRHIFSGCIATEDLVDADAENLAQPEALRHMHSWASRRNV